MKIYEQDLLLRDYIEIKYRSACWWTKIAKSYFVIGIVTSVIFLPIYAYKAATIYKFYYLYGGMCVYFPIQLIISYYVLNKARDDEKLLLIQTIQDS